jgi:putative transposase
LVDQDSHLLELLRYVVLNPVRAGMVGDTEVWPWSSYHATIALANLPKPAWLATDALLRHFAHADTQGDRTRAQAAYVDRMRAGVGLPSIWNQLNAQVFLGNEAFVPRMQAKLDSAQAALPNKQWQEVPSPQSKAAKRSIASYAQEHPEAWRAIRAWFEAGRQPFL